MKKINSKILVFIISSFHLLVMSSSLLAQKANPPGLKYIKESELKKDLYALADAHFKGRSAGTLDELKASMWLAYCLLEMMVLIYNFLIYGVIISQISR
jgi:hypothetical protein